MPREYHNNHDVPIWYQKRFLPVGESELFYLHLDPGSAKDSRGRVHQLKDCWRRGPRLCFVEEDLYTTRLGFDDPTEIEREFFGAIDHNGKKALDYFSAFAHDSIDYDAFQSMTLYMSTQKLRTPKGLRWLSDIAKTGNHDETLKLLVDVRFLFASIWTECVWQIADATESTTKFIISDHPVTVYNRRCGPRSDWCRGHNDPDILFHGTHTIFPLSLDRILILTNLSWVRNPYQSEVGTRPNPNPWRGAVFNYTNIQIFRHLREEEVRQINFIIKSRAFRFLGAAREDWLHPEDYVSKSQWHEYGDGYLLMPDPRTVHVGGDTLLGYKDGTVRAYDEYGRTPLQADYRKETREESESNSLDRFKGEFSRLHGPYRRGRTYDFGGVEEERIGDDLHALYLSLGQKTRRPRNGSVGAG